MMRCLQIHSGLWGLVCNPDSAADILDAKETGGKKARRKKRWCNVRMGGVKGGCIDRPAQDQCAGRIRALFEDDGGV